MGCSCSRAAVVTDSAVGGHSRAPGGSEDIRDHYKIGFLLGSGAFGQVRECRRRTDNAVYAVKIMERRGKESGHWSNEAMFRREVQMLGLLKHNNIIDYVDFYEDQHFLYAVMERCYGGELFDQVVQCKRFLEHDASHLCRQMLLALQYCHHRGVVHRDIKAENFLFKATNMASDLKLIDFGMSARIGAKNQTLSEVCGSPHYLSPELVRRRYNNKADMWALGVLIYLMLFGRYPFDSSSTDAIIREILHGKIDWNPGNVVVSEDALTFMQALLDRNPKVRLSADEALEHPWIKNSEASEEWKRRKAEQILRKGPGDLLAQVKSAHRRVSRNRRSSHRLNSKRNLLLKRLERDWLHGKTTGVRVVPNPPPNRPEYVRRNVRHNTTPGRSQGRSLADLQALRRHIEYTCGEAVTQSFTPTTAVGSKALCIGDESRRISVRNKFERGLYYDWEGAEECLRTGSSEEFSVELRRAVTLAYHGEKL